MIDQLNSVTPAAAGRAAFTALDQLQRLSPAEQVAGAALLFQVLVRHYRVDPRDALAASGRRLEDALGPNLSRKPGDYVRALADYCKGELA